MFIIFLKRMQLCHVLNKISSTHNLTANSSRTYSKIVIKYSQAINPIFGVPH